MKLRFHKRFERQQKKLGPRQQEKLYEKLQLFVVDEFNPVLNNHPLKGKYKGFRSINVSGDLRAIYKRYAEIALLIEVNSHSNLYK